MMMKGNIDMITLRDINALTNSKDGCIFSDLYKDVYGSRPGADYRFESIDAFDADMVYLSDKLDRQIEQEAAEQASNFLKFTARVAATMYLVENATRESAIEIIAEAEGIRKEQFDFYGLEILENELNLKYGSIAKWLSE
jgi:hypothetical protein